MRNDDQSDAKPIRVERDSNPTLTPIIGVQTLCEQHTVRDRADTWASALPVCHPFDLSITCIRWAVTMPPEVS